MATPRACVGIVARRLPSRHIKPEWTLVPGPFLYAMAILAGFAAAGTRHGSGARPALGRSKSGLGGTSKRPKNSDKVAQYEAETVEGWPAERGKKHAEVPAPGRACLHSNAAMAAGQIEGKPVDQFRFLGKITDEIRGRATRTERELNVG